MKKLSVLVILAMLMSLMAIGVSAAAPGMIIDYSDEPIINPEGAMDYNWIDDGDFHVIEIICTTADGDTYNSNSPEDYTTDGGATLDADKYQWVRMELKNESICPKFEFHFGGDVIGVDARCCTHIDITTNDTEYKTYIFNMKDKNKETFPVHPDSDFSAYMDTSCWTGNISNVRTDWGYIQESGGMAPEGKIMNVKYIAFFESESDANAFVYTPLKTPADYVKPETTTAAPTEATTTEAAAEGEDTTAAEGDTTAANDTTAATDASDDTTEDNNMTLIIIIGVAAVVVIVVIIVLVSKKKK